MNDFDVVTGPGPTQLKPPAPAREAPREPQRERASVPEPATPKKEDAA